MGATLVRITFAAAVLFVPAIATASAFVPEGVPERVLVVAPSIPDAFSSLVERRAESSSLDTKAEAAARDVRDTGAVDPNSFFVRTAMDASDVAPDSIDGEQAPDTTVADSLGAADDDADASNSAPARIVPDSVRVRVEIGASTDATNEQFFEETYVDTVLLGRRLVSTPETRNAGILLTRVFGARRNGTLAYDVQNFVSLGSRLSQEMLTATWAHDVTQEWRYVLLPRFEYRHDRTFDRDLEEWRGALSGRLRRSFADRTLFTELTGQGEVLESSGFGSDLLLDRRTVQIGLGIDRLPFQDAEWRLAYRLAARAFPDSAVRDHWEHGWEGRWKRYSSAGHSLLLESDLERRQTRRIAPTSRDNFWNGGGAVETDLRWRESWVLRTRVGAEAMHYDVEDDLLFFDYQILRARLGPRFEHRAWTVALESRAEALRARRNTTERYREAGGATELEYLGSRSWWSVTPAAGWRDYDDDPDDAPLHSSFAFYEIAAAGDQSLIAGLRVRLFLNGRLEYHVDKAQDARSLYFSLDVRRLF